MRSQTILTRPTAWPLFKRSSVAAFERSVTRDTAVHAREFSPGRAFRRPSTTVTAIDYFYRNGSRPRTLERRQIVIQNVIREEGHQHFHSRTPGQERRTIQNQLSDDIEALRLAPVGSDLDRVFANASELSRVYSARFLTRRLDLLRVAAAKLTMCARFVSADDRQLAVAKATAWPSSISSGPGRRPKS